MLKLWSQQLGRLKLRHFVAGLCFATSASIATELESAKPSRGPASYVPNDDVIVVPVDAELGFYEKHVLNDPDMHKNSNVQRQIKLWQENETMAQHYGLDTQSEGSLYYVPTSQEKFRLIERSYFRYLRKKGEDPFQDEGQEIIRSWTASDELDTIDEMEAAFKATQRKSASGRDLPQAFREKQVAQTKKFRFHVQPRVEQGLLIVRVSGPVDARAWVGINGQAELNIQKTFASTGTRIQSNYFVHDGRYLASIDQDLGFPGLRARLVTTKKQAQPAGVSTNETVLSEDTRFQVLYGAEF